MQPLFSTGYWRRIFKQHRLIHRLLQLNQNLFPHLYVVANLLLGIELVTYRGFTYRYLYLDSRFVMMLAVLSLLIFFGQSLQRTTQRASLTKLVLEINKLIVLPLLLINFLLISLDIYYYPNYVYSRFHINTNNMQLMLSFNILILFLQSVKNSESAAAFIWSHLKTRSIVNIIFLLTIAAFLLPNLQLVSRWIYDGSIRVAHTMRLSWEERFIYLNGGESSIGWITHYTQFVNKHVAERGVIFIPPQKESWQMEGNPYYLRWFIYPRFTVQSQEIEAPIPNEAEYVLIDHGAWPGMKEYGWPRIYIPASKIEKIVFIDRHTREETVVLGEDYDPKTMASKWGVIQLKK